MGTIQFGGLATGLDTAALIEALMEVERQPLERLEAQKDYLNNRLSAFTEFNGKLAALQSAIEDIDTTSELRSYKATPANEDYFTATASSSATPGNYQIEVKSLAVQEKEVADGVADRDTTTYSGELTLDVDSTDTVLNFSGSTLNEVAEAINDSDAEVTASIINDGTSDTPYRLVITADNAGDSINISGKNDFKQGGSGEIVFSQAQAGSQAHIELDGAIDIYSSSNTFADLIPGVTLTLNKANANNESTNLNVAVDTDEVKSKIETMVSKYNDIITFIADQSDASWGSDQALSSAKRRLQSLIVTNVGTTGNYNYLAELGLTTNAKTGNISINSTTLSNAINTDLESVEKLIVGETGVEGIASQFYSYLDASTDSIDGLLAAKKHTTTNSLRKIDRDILNMEARLEKREELLRMQFETLEQLISVMNSQSSYLTQQLGSLNND